MSDDNSVEEAWRADVRRRIDQIDSGAVQLIPWDEAFRRLRAAIDEGDASGIAEGNVFAQVRETLNLPGSSES